MTVNPSPLVQQEHQAILGICVLAAYADGNQGPEERARIQKIADGFAGEGLDLAAICQDVLGAKVTVEAAVAQLQSPAARALAYEMALCVCESDGSINDLEKKFLADLQLALHPPSAASPGEPPPIASEPPPVDVNRETELDKLILNAAILNGALEIMPHALATMAIVPLQMRLVYKVGQAYGYELDRGHLKDFLATVGVGLTSQVFEGITRQFIGNVASRFGGGFLSGLMGDAAGSAFAFASTYALGQVARKYYASGRNLTAAQLKDVFSSMLAHGRTMQSQYSGDILQRSRTVNVSDLMHTVNQQ